MEEERLKSAEEVFEKFYFGMEKVEAASKWKTYNGYQWERYVYFETFWRDNVKRATFTVFFDGNQAVHPRLSRIEKFWPAPVPEYY